MVIGLMVCRSNKVLWKRFKITMAFCIFGVFIWQISILYSAHVATSTLDNVLQSQTKSTQTVVTMSISGQPGSRETVINNELEKDAFSYAKQVKYEKARHYKPNWASLDTRPLPAWYDEAKVGIFIHWGVFSVPSFVSEWFWKMWKGRPDHPEVKQYMDENYPKGFTYAEFAPQFKADLFNPDQWAKLLKESGAKYVVLTSKHHEGYTMWPSSVSFNWNSMDVGPKRDLVGDLAAAVRRNTTLHFGLYHSLYEWYNPLYLYDKENDFNTQRFVKDKTMPELYELVNTYKPDIIWSDGDWEANDAYWNSTNFLAWLYNDSPVKETVVTNDRWGNGTRLKHGGFYSGKDRYNPGKLLYHKWENCMTIDQLSWGYRREAVLSDYLSIEDLIKILVETISCGGNILINIGPTSSGCIAPIYEERLLQLGTWLKVNGEAIYSSKPWRHQNDTVTPNLWYTSKKNCSYTPELCQINVYAILLTWPTSSTLQLTDVNPSTQTRVTLLGYQETPLKWNKTPDGHSLILHLPIINFNEMPCQWAWTFKLTNLI